MKILKDMKAELLTNAAVRQTWVLFDNYGINSKLIDWSDK